MIFSQNIIFYSVAFRLYGSFSVIRKAVYLNGENRFFAYFVVNQKIQMGETAGYEIFFSFIEPFRILKQCIERYMIDYVERSVISAI